MSGPTFAPVDEPTADLLVELARSDGYETFLRICKHVADNNDGVVSVQKVRDLVRDQCPDLLATPRRYSSYWSRACHRGGPMVKVWDFDVCTDRQGKNTGKPQALRRWVA